jgi:hypothetical protein
MFDVPAYQELFEKPEMTSWGWSLGMTEDQVSVCSDVPGLSLGLGWAWFV